MKLLWDYMIINFILFCKRHTSQDVDIALTTIISFHECSSLFVQNCSFRFFARRCTFRPNGIFESFNIIGILLYLPRWPRQCSSVRVCLCVCVFVCVRACVCVCMSVGVYDSVTWCVSFITVDSVYLDYGQRNEYSSLDYTKLLLRLHGATIVDSLNESVSVVVIDSR